MDGAVFRVLELVRERLGAVDARIEIGGRPPEDPCQLFESLPGGARVVAIFETPPADRDTVAHNLHELTRSFAQSVSGAFDLVVLGSELASRRLDDELARLADQAGAVRAVVVDVQSPVLWGTSEIRRGDEDVESALRTARALGAAEQSGVDFARLLERSEEQARELLVARGVDAPLSSFLLREAERVRQRSRRSGAAWRQHLLSARGIAHVRSDGRAASSREVVHDAGFGLLSRGFANIYRLVLVFDGDFSELHAEGAVVHVLPVIEKLVLALPPVEPPPKGGRVIRLPTPGGS
ncbi:MAG: hypothetical protein R3B13_29040 [Polyangiaceae bacterium]